MKKIFLISVASLSIVASVFAISKTDLINNITSTTNYLINKLNQKYISYKKEIQNLQAKLWTWDYKVLCQLTGISLSWLKQDLQTKYDTLNREIIDKKYGFLWQIDEAENKLNAWDYTTGDFEEKLNDINASLSWYKTTYENKIKIFSNQISWDIANFNNELQKKYNKYLDKIKKYNAYKKKLNSINKKFENLKNNYNKLIKIIWIWKELIDTKSEEIQNYSLNYFSGLIEKEYESYYRKDVNMAYFKSGLDLKKQVLLGFVQSKLSSTLKNIIESYYPDVNIKDLEETINNLNSKSVQDVLKDYSLNMNFLWSFEQSLDDAYNKIKEKLDKLKNSENKAKIFDVLKSDIVKSLEETSKVVLEDIKNSLETYYSLLSVLEKQEKILMDKVYEEYNKNFSEDLNKLNYLLELIKTYKEAIRLPENIRQLENMENQIKQKIEEIKNKEILDKINKLSSDIDSLQVSDENKLKELKSRLDELKKLNKFQDKLKELEMKLKLKENLYKLYKAWAIKYYYQLGDLTNTVANILKKYYDKYKAKWKEGLFMKKIDKALEKLQLLEESLGADKRSYYLIMIHNGIIKFKYQIEK
jgi:DNA repair exonuclease SbcCD ATPase subunit